MEEQKKRINRIIGQLNGITKMVDQEREVSEILTQIAAIKRAIDGFSKDLVLHAIHEGAGSEKDLKKVIDLLIRF